MTCRRPFRDSTFMLPAFLLLALVAFANDNGIEEVHCDEDGLIRAVVAPLDSIGVSTGSSGSVVTRDLSPASDRQLQNVAAYDHLVEIHTFDEVWPAEQGEASINVHGEIWTKAIQTALDECAHVVVHQRDAPYYLDGPLVLRSGCSLHLARQAELRLKPGSNCCMVRNEHLISGHSGPLQLAQNADADITVSGGIWTTLATSLTQHNGNIKGWADATHSLASHGVLLFSNVERLQVRDVTIRQCKPHAIQISNCRHFLVKDVRFDHHRRDGVHVNGPAAYGVIRRIRCTVGVMGDDMIALNAWDWKNTSMTFGPIHHILIEDVNGLSEAASQSGRDRRSEIRLLAGTKRFDDGDLLACDIEHCVLRHIDGIRAFKMYDQPNLELGRHNDFADPIGNLRDLHFSRINVERPTDGPLFQIALNGDGIVIRDVSLGFNPLPPSEPPYALVQVGPRSQTYKHNPDDAKTWVEIFSPDKDCTVSNLSVRNILGRQVMDAQVQCKSVDPDALVQTIAQKPNPDYPNTTPRGGTGRGYLK